ncbi:hypothetical protein KC717_06825, partial [Candidatus Dojkabacteria bacterium]|nr:hypothetical protein [Candidatus Dojkabacteria bacterium]
MTEPQPVKTIVFLDDDFIIRFVIKKYIHQVARQLGMQIRIFTSNNGVEGLGLLYVTNPDVVIVDLTLPKFSGGELVNLLSSNATIQRNQTPVFALVESEKEFDKSTNSFDSSFSYISKSHPKFLLELIDAIFGILSPEHNEYLSKKIHSTKGSFFTNAIGNIIHSVATRSIFWANIGNKLTRKGKKYSIFETISITLSWFWVQLIVGFYLGILYLLIGKDTDDNNIQHEEDLSRFRVRYYPTFATLFTSFVFLIVQIVLFVLGGVTIINRVQIESAFASISPSQEFSFDNASFDSDVITYDDNGFSLISQFGKPVVVESTPPQRTRSNEIEPEELPENDSGSTIIEENEEVEVLPTESGSVLGISDINVRNDLDKVGVNFEVTENTPQVETNYSTNRPSIVLEEPVRYVSLGYMYEDSNINSPDTSLPLILQGAPKADTGSVIGSPPTLISAPVSNPLSNPSSGPILGFEPPNSSPITVSSLRKINGVALAPNQEIAVDDLAVRVLPENAITYQLSPNKLDWYYYSSDGAWSKTTAGWSTSNTIQEVNQFIEFFPEDAGQNSGELYVQIFFHSDGDTPIQLSSLTIERELQLVNILSSFSTEDEEDVVDSITTYHVANEDGISITKKNHDFKNINSDDLVPLESRILTNTFTEFDHAFELSGHGFQTGFSGPEDSELNETVVIDRSKDSSNILYT